MTDTFDYANSLATADRLITKFGQPILVRKATNSGTPFDPVQSTNDYATVAAVIEYTAQQRAGTDILATDRRALVAAGPLTALGVTAILPADALVIGGVEVSVVIAKPLNPAGTVVMFDCQIRA